MSAVRSYKFKANLLHVDKRQALISKMNIILVIVTIHLRHSPVEEM